MAVEDRIAQMVEEALEETMKDLRARINSTAERVLAERLAEHGFDDDFITRYEASEEFGVPVWKIRDLQLNKKVGPILHRGKHALVSRKALAAVLTRRVA